jgi:predicted DNA binding CopG/RHH family protein
MKNNKVILDYDKNDTTSFIDKSKPKTLGDIGIKLPKDAPTKVISIRLPTGLYNNIRAFSTNLDIPYQATIKMLLEKGIQKEKSNGFGKKSLRKTG